MCTWHCSCDWEYSRRQGRQPLLTWELITNPMRQNWTWNNGLVPNRKVCTALEKSLTHTVYQQFLSYMYIPRRNVCTLFQIGKPCLFNFYAEYITRNAGLDEVQAGIKIARGNFNNLRYADDTTLIAKSEEEPRASWCKWKRSMKKLA